MSAIEFAEVLIDSREADTSGREGIASTDYPVFQKRDIFQTVVGLKVLEVTFPFSYYTINDLTNTIPLRWNNNLAFVTIPNGNYLPNELVATVNPLTATAIATAGGGGSLVLSYSTITNKFTFTFTSAPANSRITFNPFTAPVADATFPQNHPAYLLGYYSNDNVFGRTFQNLTATTTGDATANLSGPDYLFLRSNLAGFLGNKITTTSSFTASQGTVIATIPIDVNRNEVLHWRNHNIEYFTISPEVLNRLEFYFTDYNNTNVIQFNGRPFRIRLGLLFANSNTTRVMPAAGGQRSIFVSEPYLQ